ncbi:ArsR/SmtB family transcription factor [Deinococcus sp. SL84]|uniref:ArsR/SmtB family transcription factor n=1 Tax=Deinococcus sp. SL84 TaxID=2994663 RepID=UPI0022729922|nr:metalloregulator ArsR/SmtB family transcription factor [Deinococcus sp. SL84]MCY1703775.1 metalloregulator ArsR/SmtB family transcription factor [Deinococcus sp. SL84]
MDFDTSAELFKALADPNRLKVLKLLAAPQANSCAPTGTVCACDLEDLLGLSQPTISHHMRLLVRVGLVTATKRGKWTDYTLNAEGFAEVRSLLTALEQPDLITAAPRQAIELKGAPS